MHSSGTPRHLSRERIDTTDRRRLKCHREWLLRIGYIDQPRRRLGESSDSDGCSGICAELQLIRFGRIGMREGHVDSINQADVVASLLCCQCNGVRTVCENSVRDGEVLSALLLACKVYVAERRAIQCHGDIVLLAFRYALQYD